MAIFDDNLKPEEIQSGFTPEEADTEVFSLDAFGGKYPGNIPDYDESTFLNFKSKPIINAVQPNTEINETDETENIDINISEDIDEALNEFDLTDEQNIPTSEDENDNSEIEEAEITTIENIDETIENTDETTSNNAEDVIIDFDDDFKKTLLEDIEKGALRQAAKQEKNLIEESEKVLQSGTSSEIEINDGPETFTADLMKMEIETTETTEDQINENEDENNDKNEDLDKNIENLTDNEINSIEQKIPKINKKENLKMAKTANNKEKEEVQNKKKTMVLIIAIIGLVSLLIVGGIIGYLYISGKDNSKSDKKEIAADTTQTEHSDISAEDTIEVDSHKDSHKIDSALADTTATIDATKAKDTIAEKIEQHKPVEVAPKPTRKIERPINPVRQQPQFVERKSPATVESKSKKAVEVGAVYTIQIYSSPSRTDAETRLNLLKQKNIDGIISTQQVKGNTWYRVRFGNYSSYEEAQVAASKYGFSDAWIERVK